MIANAQLNITSTVSKTDSSRVPTLTSKQYKTFQEISTKLQTICSNNDYVGHTKPFVEAISNFVDYVNTLVPDPDLHQVTKKRKRSPSPDEMQSP